MSTLLSDLETSSGPAKDGDLVDQIIKEMNGGAGGGPQGANMFVPPQPPPSPAMMPSNPGMMPVQMSNTALSSHHMDNGPATAHMIGGSQPTPADFAAAMHGGAPLNHAEANPTPAYEHQVVRSSKRSMLQRIGEEFKIPMLVALLVFVFSLPVVNFLFAHYLPYLVLPTGQLKTLGLVIKSLAAGVMFWILQRIIVPLFSL
jgi:hypothetical protein